MVISPVSMQVSTQSNVQHYTTKSPAKAVFWLGLFVLRDLCGFLHPCRQNLPEEPPLITQSAVGSTPPPQQTTSNR